MEAAADAQEKIVQAIEAGDFARVADFIWPDSEFRGTVGGLDEQIVLYGPDAAIGYFVDVAATWDEWRFEREQVHVNGDTFVIFWRETSISRGIEMVNETATLFTLRDGKISFWRGYLDRDAALAAAGL